MERPDWIPVYRKDAQTLVCAVEEVYSLKIEDPSRARSTLGQLRDMLTSSLIDQLFRVPGNEFVNMTGTYAEGRNEFADAIARVE